MKRIIICLTIIALIIAAGIAAIYTVSEKNDRLYGRIESVLSAYESGGVMEEIESLKSFFEGEYVPTLGAFIDDDSLAEMSVYISRLAPMVESDCDEFRAECEALKAEARKLYLGELPLPFRIL